MYVISIKYCCLVQNYLEILFIIFSVFFFQDSRVTTGQTLLYFISGEPIPVLYDFSGTPCRYGFFIQYLERPQLIGRRCLSIDVAQSVLFFFQITIGPPTTCVSSASVPAPQNYHTVSILAHDNMALGFSSEMIIPRKSYVSLVLCIRY